MKHVENPGEKIGYFLARTWFRILEDVDFRPFYSIRLYIFTL